MFRPSHQGTEKANDADGVVGSLKTVPGSHPRVIPSPDGGCSSPRASNKNSATKAKMGRVWDEASPPVASVPPARSAPRFHASGVLGGPQNDRQGTES